MTDGPSANDELSRLYQERERAAGQFDATQLDATDDGNATRTGPFVNRQDLDIAVAGLLLEEQVLDERRLSSAVADWTIHGSRPLLEHLVATEAITPEQAADLDARAQRRLEQAVESAKTDGTGDDYGATVLALNQMDSGARAATVLGLSSNLVSTDNTQTRRCEGDYTVLRRLGQGGLGVVWLARDNRLHRYVAIKEVTEAARHNSAAIARFRREAVITGRLEHPSIVPIHQYAEDTETGRVFYVMRFLGKQTLQNAITEYHERRESGDDDPLQLHRLLSAFVTVCQAIAYAHSRDVVHRDLKPENVALDGFGQVIVLDWGLAKLIGEVDLLDGLQIDLGGSADDSNHTVAGQVMGTPMYMSPEQAAGRVDEIDARTDVYGLGAILFAIVTGSAPHELSHRSLSSRSAMGELLTAIMTNPVPTATKLNPNVPPELAAICARALARKRYARYQSASALADDVERWMAGEPVSAWEEPWKERIQRWVRAHKRLSQAIAAGVTVLLVSTLTMGILTHQNSVIARDARLDNLRAEAQELEIRLGSRAATLTNHVRFMAELPPIQGIIDAGHEGRDGDGADVWTSRLETIFRGLLRSNHDYLKVSYCSIGDEIQELARVERNMAEGSYVRVLPASRLRTFEHTDNVQVLLGLSPGDVWQLDAHAVDQEGVTSGDANLSLLAVTPIFDEVTGDIFGLVGIEMNLERVLEALLESTKAAAHAYVTDARGKVLMHQSRDDGLQHTAVGRPVSEVVGELANFFGTGAADSRSDDETYYATRFRLGRRSDGVVIGLVVTLD